MTRTEYRITGRLRKEDKRHVVDISRKWSLQDAQNRFNKLVQKCEYEHNTRIKQAIKQGLISVGTEYCSNYDLLELKIESRTVTPWEEV